MSTTDTTPTSVWQSLHKLDDVLGQSLPWSQRMQTISTVLLDVFTAHGIWLLTVAPLPANGCGIVRAPVAVNPDAKVEMNDSNPGDGDALPPGILKQILTEQTMRLDPAHLIDLDIGAGTLLFSQFGGRAVAVAPLVTQQNAVGALVIAQPKDEAAPLAPDKAQLLAYLSHHLALNLQNAYLVRENVDLYQAAEQRATQQAITNRIATVINTGRGLSETAKIIVSEFKKLLVVNHLSISILDDTRTYVRQWTFSEYGSLSHAKTTIPRAESALAQLIIHNAPIIDTNIATRKPPFPDDKILLDDNIKSKLSIPLSRHNQIFGSLNLGHRYPNFYTADHITLLSPLLPQLSTAIDRAHLIDALEQRTNQLQMLNRMGEMLVSTHDLSLIIDTALSMLPRLLPGDVQGVIILDDNSLYVGLATPFDFVHTDETIENLLETFSQLSENELPTDITYSKTIAGNLPVSATWEPTTTLALPMLSRLGTLGAIFMLSGQPEDLSDELWRTFSLIVSQMSAVVENARLFRQVEQERARLSAILTSSTDAILVVNRHGQIVLDNPAAWTVMDVEQSQRGQALNEATTNQELIAIFEKTINGGEPTGEIPLADGRTYFAYLSPVVHDAAGITGWVATMQDVSHLKELNELKTDFVNAVSHDLRSPLAGILIASNLMSQLGDISPAQQDLLQTIGERVRAMSALIDDLLDVGKIEAGIDFELDLCRLPQLISEVVDNLLPQATHKQIEIITEVAPDLPYVRANISRLRQVMTNLLHNGIKYTPAGGQVTVKAHALDTEVRIQVIDTGFGIPAADQPHIFEKFYRVHGDHVQDIKGTGLGLAICKSIVERHNGRIWLESTLGQGSNFTVALPLYPL